MTCFLTFDLSVILSFFLEQSKPLRLAFHLKSISFLETRQFVQ